MATKARETGLRISVSVGKEEHDQIRKISSVTGIPDLQSIRREDVPRVVQGARGNSLGLEGLLKNRNKPGSR